MERPEAHTGNKRQIVLSRLTHVTEKPKCWEAYCPVHENDGARHKPSLFVSKDNYKWVGMVCRSRGCDYWDIVAALGLTSQDVALDDSPWDPNGQTPKKTPVPRREQELEAKFAAQLLQREPDVLSRLRADRGWAAPALDKLGVGWFPLENRLTLPVYDKDGKFHDAVRYDPFRKAKRKTLAGEGKSRLPWPAPEKVERNGALHIVEGEGTAISMTSIGLPAVALPGGMPQGRNVVDPGKFRGSGWHPAWAKRLAAHRDLVFWPDCDGDGERLMTVAATGCENEGARVTVISLGGPPKFDVGDMLRYARNLEVRKEARS